MRRRRRRSAAQPNVIFKPKARVQGGPQPRDASSIAVDVSRSRWPGGGEGGREGGREEGRGGIEHGEGRREACFSCLALAGPAARCSHASAYVRTYVRLALLPAAARPERASVERSAWMESSSLREGANCCCFYTQHTQSVKNWQWREQQWQGRKQQAEGNNTQQQ
jgi:hypothetical protein